MVGHKRIVPASLSMWLCIFILNFGNVLRKWDSSFSSFNHA